MDDYYEIMGVDADAATDEIRTAYREKKEALSAMTGGTSKADAAKLNKAWNVLADPYQRGRYDEQRAQAIENDDLGADGDDIVVESSSGNGTKRGATRATAARGRAGGRGRQRQMPPPTITPPDGTHYPQTKQRLVAMGIDLVVILGLFLASLAITTALQKSMHPDAYKTRSELNNHTIPDAQTNYNDAKKALDQANKGTDETAKQQAQAKVDQTKTALDNAKQQLTDVNNTLLPIQNTITMVLALVVLLYLAVPSAITGRTLGKRMQQLKVVRVDGGPIGWGGALRRYGLIVLAAVLLSYLLAVIGPVLVLFGITTWMRNPNQQGLHDRIAKTIVVSDAPA